MTAADWIERLRDLTVAPPVTDIAAEILAAWTPIASARRALFDAPDRPASLPRELAPLVAELKAREDAWASALAAARERVVAARVGMAKARRYQRASGAAELARR
ncbi:MAG TPA: hypothetical protein VH143_07305 [Kofleriaceae bacterium]|jgi:hypothetical protein|nr:hypothetical protein [Kofleriaceae bacterium]